MYKILRIAALFILTIYALFCSLALVDGVYHLARSDVELFLYGGAIVSGIGFFTIIILEPFSEEVNPLKGNVLSLWLKRRKLEEEKRIKELQEK
ncbi:MULTISPECIES: hypothetical protein [Lelliottia]|uniref:Uncharacterized protein n=1 Tax=Lelliottia wanjuensis TaxID=3050585 RepID=A0AAP4D226_9ENTR|nr:MULTISPECIES: hypothetical protein [unclassified Lelliottia]MDK9363627.1 hypothetical protein [Lelliottia sp. V106_12]MDK9586439.1 hypothetical protein [Lelliottia sp. V86_10]MDK9617495.1 hypothetical protein [Lelliottia sp. V106_9]